MKAKHSIVSFPSLGNFNPLGQDVNSTDVLIGAVAGLAGSGAIKFAVGKLGIALPDFLTKFWPLVGSSAAGAALYAAQRGSNKRRGKGHFVGAVGAGVALTAWDLMKAQLPGYFDDVVGLRYGRYAGYGLMANNPGPQMQGLIVDNSRSNLGALAAMSMGESDDMDGLMSLE